MHIFSLFSYKEKAYKKYVFCMALFMDLPYTITETTLEIIFTLIEVNYANRE